MSEQPKPKYSVVDLFSGAGGLSYGFLQTGRYTVKAAFENNPNAQSTYRENHANATVYDDVSRALDCETKKELGEVDVVIGGPPCQGFSSANRQKNHAISQNNSLVKKYIKAVLHLNPNAFIMENVSMLQSDIHFFYVSEDDKADIETYKIITSKKQIILAEPKYIFDGVTELVANATTFKNLIWAEKDYLVLNIIYKKRNNPQKLIEALVKYKKKLLTIAERLLEKQDEQNPILNADCRTGRAVLACFPEGEEAPIAENLGDAIEMSIMIQRMLGKAKEIHENRIIVEKFTTENGLVAHVTAMAVVDYIQTILGSDFNGYIIEKGVLSAAEFGAPQKRMRFVIMGVKKSISDKIEMPKGILVEDAFLTVKDAIGDLQLVETRTEMADDVIGIELPDAPEGISELGKMLRDSTLLKNHISTATTPEALERFKAIKQGENFHSLPDELKKSYSDSKRTQNTIYLRLKYDEPSGTVVNIRKSMWIHPELHRAMSIREAARLQTFPDSFVFHGTKDSQYQQVGNAVPPILANAIATHLCAYLDKAESAGQVLQQN